MPSMGCNTLVCDSKSHWEVQHIFWKGMRFEGDGASCHMEAVTQV